MGKNVLCTLFGCLKPKAAGENGRKNDRTCKKNKVHPPKEQQAKLQPKVEKEIQRPRVEELISLEDNLIRKEEFLSHQLAAACVTLIFGYPNASAGPGLIDKNKQLRLEIASLRGMIISIRAELARLHTIKMELERASQNSNAAAAASTSLCASTSVPQQAGDSLALAVEPQSVQDDEFDPLNLQALEDRLNKKADNVTKKYDSIGKLSSSFTEIRSIDIKTAIPIEESRCTSTEIPCCSTSQVDADDTDKEKAEEQFDKESQDEDVKMMKKRVTIKMLSD